MYGFKAIKDFGVWAVGFRVGAALRVPLPGGGLLYGVRVLAVGASRLRALGV